jgi:hypothetical protein
MSTQPAKHTPTFERWIVLCCDWLLSQRSFELIVAPALADFEFEVDTGRRITLSSRAAVIRALAGGVVHEMQQGSGSFLKLTLLSACYYLFPVAVSIRLFETWSAFFQVVLLVFAMSLTPVVVCFWPARRVRQTD